MKWIWGKAYKGVLLPGRVRQHSGGDFDSIQMFTSLTMGRGFVATRRLRPGERILCEEPIVAHSLADLTQRILNTPHLRVGLHMPAHIPVRDDAPTNIKQDEWSRAMAQAQCNGFRAQGGKMLLLETTALFNHSCSPNAAIYPHEENENMVQVRMLRDVLQGQEVAICYDSALLKMPKQLRQHTLWTRWGFKCGCSRCIGAESNSIDKLLTATRSDAQHTSTSLELRFEQANAFAEEAINAVSNLPEIDLEAAGFLEDAIAFLHDVLAQAESQLDVTHWRMQQTIKNLCRCLCLQVGPPASNRHAADASSSPSPSSFTGCFDADLGFYDASVARLRHLLHIGLAAEEATKFPALHPMRLELYGMWRALSHTGDEWKTVGVFEHLERLWALWKHGEGMSRSGRGGFEVLLAI